MRKQLARKRIPRPIDPMGGLGLLNRRTTAPVEEVQLRDLGLAYLGALRGMTTKHGNENMWHTLACSINVAMVLSEMGVMPQGMSVIHQGQDALIRVKAHAEKSGEWKLGANAFPIECAFKFHHQQIKEASRGQLITALEEVHRRLDAGRCL